MFIDATNVGALLMLLIYYSYANLIIENNGYSPTWNEVFTFEIMQSQLAFVRFRILDNPERRVLAQYCISVESIRPGFRIIPLNDIRGKSIPCCNLLCNFSFVE
eukprot:TRINITY_DN3230_c3_g1_i2.p1 TRINITY_DN3230_c3_g1~~TRINITY_DN3230_c3_g1_i2.p1  ORF type:complete len:104 (-),score=16.90 TRINITY_DN3230_c3_g1_i2:53-364(-)